MTPVDVFNGDADGPRALHQLRLERGVTVDSFDHHPAGELPRHPGLRDAAWSRRVFGVFGDRLPNPFPDVAHAVLTPNAQGDEVVNVRAPVTVRTGVDALCPQFPTGRERSKASGINHLRREALPEFARRFERAFHASPR
jgi:hypothetical protein